jgi:uncharacterized RmlC-like cupin family protein
MASSRPSRTCCQAYAKCAGARTGEFAASAKAGDFIHVPAFLPHMEINPSDSQPFRWVVVRSTSTPIVVNLSEDTWRSFSDARNAVSG